tara:strand:+ start:133 stop:297 length:165 start_codon:yes stop_codon:yes gene_type:complete
MKRELLETLIIAQNLLDKAEDELGGFCNTVKGQRRTIDEIIRKYQQITKPVSAE